MKEKNDWYYMSQCLKAGIRVYPKLKYGYYYLVVEFNKTSEFLRQEVIKSKVGEVRYDKDKQKVWTAKMLELYRHLYDTKVMPKMGAA